jgi:hypothetical protein
MLIRVPEAPVNIAHIQKINDRQTWPAMSVQGPTATCLAKWANVRFSPAGSTDRRNTGVKSLCWGFELQGLTWPFV